MAKAFKDGDDVWYDSKTDSNVTPSPSAQTSSYLSSPDQELFWNYLFNIRGGVLIHLPLFTAITGCID